MHLQTCIEGIEPFIDVVNAMVRPYSSLPAPSIKPPANAASKISKVPLAPCACESSRVKWQKAHEDQSQCQAVTYAEEALHPNECVQFQKHQRHLIPLGRLSARCRFSTHFDCFAPAIAISTNRNGSRTLSIALVHYGGARGLT